VAESFLGSLEGRAASTGTPALAGTTPTWRSSPGWKAGKTQRGSSPDQACAAHEYEAAFYADTQIINLDATVKVGKPESSLQQRENHS
jgi:hypothetical protein